MAEAPVATAGTTPRSGTPTQHNNTAQPEMTQSNDEQVNGENEEASNSATERDANSEGELVKREPDSLRSDNQEPEPPKSEPTTESQPSHPPHNQDEQQANFPPPLRRADSRHYPESAHASQSHYQQQNWPRAQPHQQFRPQHFPPQPRQPPPTRPPASEFAQYHPSESFERRKSVTFNSALHSEGQQGLHFQNNLQLNRIPPQGIVRRPSPWALLKEKLPAESRGRPIQGGYSQQVQIRSGPGHDHPNFQMMQNPGENVTSPAPFQQQRSPQQTSGPQSPVPPKGLQDTPNGCRPGEQQARPPSGYPPTGPNYPDMRSIQRQMSGDRSPPFQQRPDSVLRSPHPDLQHRSPSPNPSTNRHPFDPRGPSPTSQGSRAPTPRLAGEDSDNADLKQMPQRFGPPQSRPQSGMSRPFPQGVTSPLPMNAMRPHSGQPSPGPGAQLRRDPSQTSLDGRTTPNPESRPQPSRPPSRSMTPTGNEKTPTSSLSMTPSPQPAHNYGRQTSLSSLQEETANKDGHQKNIEIKMESSASPTNTLTPTQPSSRESTTKPLSAPPPHLETERPRPAEAPTPPSTANSREREIPSRPQTGDVTSRTITKQSAPPQTPESPPDRGTAGSSNKTSRPNSGGTIVDDEECSLSQKDEGTVSSPFPDSSSKPSSACSKDGGPNSSTPINSQENDLVTTPCITDDRTIIQKDISELKTAVTNIREKLNESKPNSPTPQPTPIIEDCNPDSTTLTSLTPEMKIENTGDVSKIPPTPAYCPSAVETAIINSKTSTPSPGPYTERPPSKDISDHSNSRTASRTSTERSATPKNAPEGTTPSRASASSRTGSEEQAKRPSSLKKPAGPIPKDGVQENRIEDADQKKSEAISNGTHASPSKSPTKLPTPKKLGTPSPLKSPSKPGTKTPEMPSTAEKKKVPMNKIQVGAAPSPNLKTVKSKIGSLDNTSYKPGGGHVKIENRKLDFSKTQPKIAAKNDTYSPGGGDKKIQQVKLQWNAKPKVGSLDNAAHKPGGGDKKIETVKLDFKEKAKPKVGSKDNLKHTPGGGTVKNTDDSHEENPGDIEDQKLELKAQSKVGSLNNVKYKPGGGDKKIFDDKEYLKQMSSLAGEHFSSSQEHISKPGRNKSSDRKSTASSSKSYEELREDEGTTAKPTDQNFNQLSDKISGGDKTNFEIMHNNYTNMEGRLKKCELGNENQVRQEKISPPKHMRRDKSEHERERSKPDALREAQNKNDFALETSKDVCLDDSQTDVMLEHS